ncbi:hypothetical protein PIB30_017306 [Stylosanthes scabra]|uniref:PB1-like domain-containing protein n=1 Tax=Stylosanthes scabra TaxID=79078 RepID=A0ABU6S7Y0_9FABA|nr:hypothetical protein [Stylosanthes scabra]
MYCGGWFGHVDGIMKYKNGEKTIVVGQDGDFWSVYEAQEYLRHLDVDDKYVSAMWYKDSLEEDFSVGLMQFENDRDALEMVRIGELRGYVELYVVHTGREPEGFPEIGYIDVGGKRGWRRKKVLLMPMGAMRDLLGGKGDDAAAIGGDGVVEEGVATEGGEEEEGVAEEGNGASAEGDVDGEGVTVAEEGATIPEEEDSVDPLAGVGEEDSEESKYVPSKEVSDSANDIHFTDSDEVDDLDDGWFGESGRGSNEAEPSKGKRVLNQDFYEDDEADNDDLRGASIW